MTFDRHDFSLRFFNDYYMIYLLWITTRYLFCMFSAQQMPPTEPKIILPHLCKAPCQALLQFLPSSRNSFVVYSDVFIMLQVSVGGSSKVRDFECMQVYQVASKFLGWLFVKKAADSKQTQSILTIHLYSVDMSHRLIE